MVKVAIEAAEIVEQDNGATIEILDLRTIAPLDEETIVASVNKTGRAVIVHEAPRTGGVAAEVIAVINEQCLYALLKPVERVTGPDTAFPVPKLEDVIVPNAQRVAKAIYRTLEP
jgi:pyruvate dehydrogenase E1 component beta subunit